MRTFFVTLAIFCLMDVCPAQVKQINVDSMVDAMNIKDIHDPDLLCDTLLTPFTADSQKVRAIFYWIARNIGYDCKEFHANNHFFKNEDDAYNYYDKTVDRTLLKKKGICFDYATTFKYMCNYAKIKCELVEGYGLLTAPDFSVRLQPSDASNHAWNAVCINNKWYLTDVTWASGYTDAPVTKFTRSFNNKYYLTPPTVFIQDHHPEDSQWQLLANPYVTMGQWVDFLQGKNKTEANADTAK